MNFQVDEGTFFTILGPNGCGKTTLLNILVGLSRPDSGRIILDGEDITGVISGKFGYMLQKDLLLPWRTVYDNMKLITEIDGSQRYSDSIIKEYLRKVNLLSFEKYYPHQLSGGMIKRVTLARTLLYCELAGANVILMDEPFANLDSITKHYLEADLKKILKNEGKTIIFVTHDIDEALLLSDKISILTKRPTKIKETISLKNSLKKRTKETLKEKIMENLRKEVELDETKK